MARKSAVLGAVADQQLQRSTCRSQGVQETVNACVKQSKELEAINHKLEESHQMLTDARHTSVARG